MNIWILFCLSNDKTYSADDYLYITDTPRNSIIYVVQKFDILEFQNALSHIKAP